jgi:hypothetical protein
MKKDSPRNFPTPQPLSLARDETAHTSLVASGGVVLASSPFQLTVPNQNYVSPLPTNDSVLVRTDPPVKTLWILDTLPLGTYLKTCLIL